MSEDTEREYGENKGMSYADEFPVSQPPKEEPDLHGEQERNMTRIIGKDLNERLNWWASGSGDNQLEKLERAVDEFTRTVVKLENLAIFIRKIWGDIRPYELGKGSRNK